MSESVIELQTQLAEYNEQAAQIDALLSADPSSEEFSKLRSDLGTLIAMTETLLENATAATAAPVAENSSHDAATTCGEMDQPEAADAAPMVSAQADQEQAQEPAAAIEPEFSATIPVAPCSIKAASGGGLGPISEGDVVLVSGGDRPYAGYVTGTVEGGSGVRVRYYEYATEVELPWSAVAHLPPGPVDIPNRDALASGRWNGQCKYAADGLYYNATITEVTPFGARVTYPQFGNSEEVPLAYLRPNLEKVVKPEKAGSADGLQEIPAKYQIADTDTEQERKYKLKKIKSIKSKNKEITKETEVAAVQKSWQKFVAKGNKRNLQGMTKSSMFSGSSSVAEEGGGDAGATMTEQQRRKKHKFN